MLRLVVVFALAALVVLAALTAFGSAGGWVAAVVLAVVAAMWFVRHGPPAVHVILLVGTLLAALYIPAARIARHEGQRASCVSRLKSLVLALHSYHQAFDAFPPAFIADDEGRPMHGWRVLVLPYIAEGSLYDRYDFDEPWDGPNNRLLIERGSAAFRCFSDARPREAGITNYTEEAIRWGGFFTLLAAAVALLIAVRGVRRLPRQEKQCNPTGPLDACCDQLAASGREFSDSASLLREGRER